MAKINEYYRKRNLLDQLSEELKQLENDQALQSDLEFEKKVKELMDEYGKSAVDVHQILVAIDPSISVANTQTSKTRKPKAAVTYTNPHTGESVTAKGANHKILKEWRKEYGHETVKSWAS